MFSPYYAAARRRGAADPAHYCALNVALYGSSSKHWALTERRRSALHRDAQTLSIGPSALSWDGDRLVVDIDELAVPRLSRLRGRITLDPEALTRCDFGLDAAGRHRWRPIAPRARVTVAMAQPDFNWTGSGYFDSNAGAAPLEDDFATWTWSRADIGDGAAILYDVIRRDGSELGLALRVDHAGNVTAFDPPPEMVLPRTGWRIGRRTRSDNPGTTAVIRTLEDTPFYARSALTTTLLGQRCTAMHESLSLDRFRNRVVQAMLPFRMPRTLR